MNELIYMASCDDCNKETVFDKKDTFSTQKIIPGGHAKYFYGICPKCKRTIRGIVNDEELWVEYEDYLRSHKFSSSMIHDEIERAKAIISRLKLTVGTSKLRFSTKEDLTSGKSSNGYIDKLSNSLDKLDSFLYYLYKNSTKGSNSSDVTEDKKKIDMSIFKTKDNQVKFKEFLKTKGYQTSSIRDVLKIQKNIMEKMGSETSVGKNDLRSIWKKNISKSYLYKLQWVLNLIDEYEHKIKDIEYKKIIDKYIPEPTEAPVISKSNRKKPLLMNDPINLSPFRKASYLNKYKKYIYNESELKLSSARTSMTQTRMTIKAFKNIEMLNKDIINNNKNITQVDKIKMKNAFNHMSFFYNKYNPIPADENVMTTVKHTVTMHEDKVPIAFNPEEMIKQYEKHGLTQLVDEFEKFLNENGLYSPFLSILKERIVKLQKEHNDFKKKYDALDEQTVGLEKQIVKLEKQITRMDMEYRQPALAIQGEKDNIFIREIGKHR